jgi:hypothetical protein
MTTAKKTAATKETSETVEKATNELELLRAQVARLEEEKALRDRERALKEAAEEEARLLEAVGKAGPRKERKPLRLQSRYRGYHAVQLKPHRRVIHPTLGIIEPVLGVYAEFGGPQRLFDSEVAQEKNDWDDDTTDAVERMLVMNDGFMSDYYPAPMSEVPEHLLALAKRKPPAMRKRCQGFGFKDGVLDQCPAEPQAGSIFCKEHDPDVTRILHGAGTTTG